MGTRNPMRVNYFLSALGEILQRMDDSTAQYSIAVPDLPQYHGLWDRLPVLCKERTQLSILFSMRGFSLAEGDHFSGRVVENHRLSVASLSAGFSRNLGRRFSPPTVNPPASAGGR